MYIAAGLDFFNQYGAQAEDVWPEIRWVFFDMKGKWSSPPHKAQIAVLTGDACYNRFKDHVA